MIDEPVPTMPDSVPAISPTVRTKRKPNGLQLQDRRDAENKTGGTPKTRPAARRNEDQRNAEQKIGGTPKIAIVRQRRRRPMAGCWLTRSIEESKKAHGPRR